MRTIVYTPRVAGTATYWDMSAEDKEFVINQLERLGISALEKDPSKDREDQNFKEWFYTRNEDLGKSPKYRGKSNTAASVVGGILSNIKHGSTRDLTDKTCEKIKIIFDQAQIGMDKKLFGDLKIEPVVFTRMVQPRTNFNEMFTEGD